MGSKGCGGRSGNAGFMGLGLLGINGMVPPGCPGIGGRNGIGIDLGLSGVWYPFATPSPGIGVCRLLTGIP